MIWSQGRRVAVHCHAGLGRTGLAIACSLVYSQRMQAAEAVKTVRAGRPGALQTAKQELFVYVFEQFVAHLRCCFPAAAAEHASSPPPAGLVAAASSISGPLTRVQREKLLQLHSPRVARAARRLQADTSPRPTPMPPGSQAFSLPNTGDVASVSAAHGMVQETYRCGLKVTRPLHLGGAGVPVAAAGADGRRATMSAIAAPTPLPPPWDERLAILPKLYSIDYVPVPPRSYADALQRQQRLVHGPERRARRHLHRVSRQMT